MRLLFLFWRGEHIVKADYFYTVYAGNYEKIRKSLLYDAGAIGVDKVQVYRVENGLLITERSTNLENGIFA